MNAALERATRADVEGALRLLYDQRLENFYPDHPLEFVRECFVWEPGEGPDTWQETFLSDLGEIVRGRTFDGYNPVEPVRMAVASGHGIGKGALIAWLHWWIMLTRRNSKGTITANTYAQLQTKTWPEVHKWYQRLRYWGDRFECGIELCYEKEHRSTWFSSPQTCAAENSEAFAGQHNRESTSFYLFDESSKIPDAIWRKAWGGCTDGEPMHFAFGNPTRNTGEFYEISFGKQRHRWNQRSIDARTCRFPNKEEQQKLIEDYGMESDEVKVQVLGQPPSASEDQLIPRAVIEEAQQRPMSALASDPLVAGVDVPDGGSAWFVVRFRRGLDARPGTLVPAPVRFAGSKITREIMISKLAAILSNTDSRSRVAFMFVDKAFGSPIVERLKMMGYRNVDEIGFGDKSPDARFANMRAFMWAGELKDWLGRGAIDPNDKKLAVDLSGPGFHHRVGGDGALVVESKQQMRERNVASPDDGDALALTFPRHVAPPPAPQAPYQPHRDAHSWMA